MALKKSSNLNVVLRCYRDLRFIADNSKVPTEIYSSLHVSFIELQDIILDAIVSNDRLYLTEY